MYAFGFRCDVFDSSESLVFGALLLRPPDGLLLPVADGLLLPFPDFGLRFRVLELEGVTGDAADDASESGDSGLAADDVCGVVTSLWDRAFRDGLSGGDASGGVC